MHNTLHESTLQWPVASTPHRKVAYSITPKLMAGYAVTWHATPRQTQKGMCAEKAVREVNKRTGSSDWNLWKSKVSANAWVKAEAVSQIDYACMPLKTQAAKVPELCWIIYRLVLVFTEWWAEFKGTRWRIKVWALWKHHHSQNEHQHHKRLQLCWVTGRSQQLFSK